MRCQKGKRLEINFFRNFNSFLFFIWKMFVKDEINQKRNYHGTGSNTKGIIISAGKYVEIFFGKSSKISNRTAKICLVGQFLEC